eukprot:293005-Prymnesium_polylepis.1
MSDLTAVRHHCPSCCRLPMSEHPDSLARYFFIGSTLGARSEPFDVNSQGWNQFATTLVFIVYLLWLHRFNNIRSKLIQETTVTAADYTLVVWGLRDAGLKTKKDVAIALSSVVQKAWAKPLGEAWPSGALYSGGRGCWVAGATTFMRAPPSNREKDASELMKQLIDLKAGNAADDTDDNAPWYSELMSDLNRRTEHCGWESIVQHVEGNFETFGQKVREQRKNDKRDLEDLEESARNR